MGHLHYKGYTGSVEYDEEANSFHGMVLGLHRDGIIFEGDSADSLKKDFEESIEDYLAHCKEPYVFRTASAGGGQGALYRNQP